MRSAENDPFGFFGFAAMNALDRRFAANGMISEDAGCLAVEDEDGTLVGSVDWFAVQHGPSSTARALNIGIMLLPEHRGRGLGSAAQAVFADYLFANTLIERLEAGTDVGNRAEQRALEKAGFRREGVARHAQFRPASGTTSSYTADYAATGPSRTTMSGRPGPPPAPRHLRTAGGARWYCRRRP